MMDIRLKTVPFDFQGKTYQLACNMMVLADVQEAYGGDFSAALRDKSPRSTMVILAAMLNDYADSQGWPERYTAKELGRELGFHAYQEIQALVISLVIDSVRDNGKDALPEEATAPAESDAEKNRTAREDAAASTLPGI